MLQRCWFPPQIRGRRPLPLPGHKLRSEVRALEVTAEPSAPHRATICSLSRPPSPAETGISKPLAELPQPPTKSQGCNRSAVPRARGPPAAAEWLTLCTSAAKDGYTSTRGSTAGTTEGNSCQRLISCCRMAA